MVQKLNLVSQRLAGHDVVVVGSVRTNSVLHAMQAPDFVSAMRPHAADAERSNPASYPAFGMTQGGLRAGRSVGRRSGRLTSRRHRAGLWCLDTCRTHRTSKRSGSTARPVI
jgi:hypothetical protein